MALRTDGNQRYNWMKNRRSLLVNWTRPRTWRCTTMSCCLSAAFSASSRLLGLNNDAPRLKRKNISATIAADVKRFCHQIKNGQGFRYTHRPVAGDEEGHVRRLRRGLLRLARCASQGHGRNRCNNRDALGLGHFCPPVRAGDRLPAHLARNLAMKIPSRQWPCATPNALRRRHPLTGSGFMLTLVRKRNKHRKSAAIPAVDGVISFLRW